MCLLKLHFSPGADLLNIVCISRAAGMRVWREAVCGWGRAFFYFFLFFCIWLGVTFLRSAAVLSACILTDSGVVAE